MFLYTTIFLVGVLLTIGINLAIIIPNGGSVGDMFLWLFIAIVICGLMSGLICVITRLLPRKFYDPHNKRFKTFKCEEKVYRFLKVKVWKDKIPELGSISGFAKNKLKDPNNPEYMKRFLSENCLADSLHFYSILGGFVMFLFLGLFRMQYFWSIGVVIFITNMILHGMSCIVQRYLRPKMMKVYDRMKKQEQLQKETSQS